MPASHQCVLALMAHPDDAEFLCAGTLLRLSIDHPLSFMRAATVGPVETWKANVQFNYYRHGIGTVAAEIH